MRFIDKRDGRTVEATQPPKGAVLPPGDHARGVIVRHDGDWAIHYLDIDEWRIYSDGAFKMTFEAVPIEVTLTNPETGVKHVIEGIDSKDMCDGPFVVPSGMTVCSFCQVIIEAKPEVVAKHMTDVHGLTFKQPTGDGEQLELLAEEDT